MKLTASFFLVFSILMISHAQNIYEIREIDSYASCGIYAVYDNNNVQVEIPEILLPGFDCPMVLHLHEDNICLLLEEKMILYNITTGRIYELFEIFSQIDGISNPVWSPCGQKICFVIINQQKLYGYKDFCRLLIIHINEEFFVIGKEKYDRPVQYHCASFCFVSNQDVRFVSSITIEYKRHEMIEERAGEFDTIQLKNK
jgi:hypothetical protein